MGAISRGAIYLFWLFIRKSSGASVTMQELKAFGNNVRLLRQQAGFSQEDLANKAGMDRSYLGAIERGEHNVSLKNILKLAKALSVPPAKLFSSEGQDGS